MKRYKMLSKIMMLLVVVCSCMALVACGGKLKLSHESLEMEQFETTQLSVDGSDTVQWTSSDPRTVQVEDGLITSLKLGSATITATNGDLKASCEITVIASTKGRTVIIDKEEIVLMPGDTDTINAVLKEDGQDIDVELKWKSDDTEIATVNEGVVTGVSSGTAVITVSAVYKGQELSKDINVNIGNPDGDSAQQGMDTKGLYIAKGESADIAEVEEKVTEGEYSQWYQVNYMKDIWGERLVVGHKDIENAFVIGPKYREYEYYGFDVVFNNDVPALTIWTGGYPVFVNGPDVTAGDGQTYQVGDLDITTKDGVSVLGTQLVKDVAYTFKIRIQKDNLENGAFGIAVAGEEGTFYIGNPYFMK
jgi:hypothetical protein